MSKITIPERKDIPDDHKWKLAELFGSDDDWETGFDAAGKKTDAYAQFKGRLHASLAVFKDALEFHMQLTHSIERLYTYAHLKSDEDKSNQHYLGMHQRAISLNTRASEQASFMIPEIQSLPQKIIRTYLQDNSLQEYRFYLEKILRYKPYTRNPAEEQILAMSREMANGPSQVFGQLDNVDLSFGTIEDESGREVELSHGNFTTFLINPNRSIREKAFFHHEAKYFRQ